MYLVSEMISQSQDKLSRQRNPQGSIIRTYNKPLSIAAMSVRNEEGSPARICG